MSNTVPASAQTMDRDDEVLHYTHGIRKKIVDKLTKGGVEIPAEDPKLLGTILNTLDGMDRAALGNKRIQADKEVAGAHQAAAAAVIATLLNQAQSAGNKPFQAPKPVMRDIPVLGNDIPAPQLVEGETDTHAAQNSFESFTKKFQKDENDDPTA